MYYVNHWIPAFAGMTTGVGFLGGLSACYRQAGQAGRHDNKKMWS